jgi:hypothetical protein
MNEGNGEYWFPAKRYGWGWGPPTAWQGWAVLGGYIAAISALPFLVPPDRQPVAFGSAVFLLTAALILVCYAKGEPPRWRWGGRDNGLR